MKIGINASFLRKQNTGIGQVTVNFLKKLAELEVGLEKLKDAQFILYLEEDIDLSLPENFKKNIFLPRWKRDDLLRKICWEKYALVKKVKEDKCDVFISLYQSATVFNHNIRHLMVVHDIILKIFPQYSNNFRKRIYWRLVQRGIHKAEKIIAVSRRTEKDLINHLGIDPRKVTVSYVAVDEIYQKDATKKDSDEVLKKYNLESGYIYSGGGLEARKNIEGVMRAYKSLVDNYGAMQKLPKLVISGKLMPKLAPLVCDVEKMVKILELDGKVQILGLVDQKDLPAIYKNASMFVYPSYYEGFGLPVLEAMWQGTPVIASKRSSLPEIGGSSILYCDPDHIDDIAMVMRNVLLNQHLRDTLKQKGKERAAKFSWERFTKKILNIVEEMK